MKKLLALLAVLCLLLSATIMGIGTVASAVEESPEADFMIFDGVLEEYIGPGGVVVIPSSAGVEEIASQAFYENTDVTAVIIPEGVTTVGYGAFQRCSNLEVIELPYSLEKIDRSSFADTAVQELVIPGKLEIIPLWSFTGNQNLRKLTISYGVKEIHTQAFFKAKAPGGLKKVVFPETVELICGGAFGGCMDKEAVEYVICNPNCEIGYWDAHFSGENNLNHSWQPTLWSPFYSSVATISNKVIVPENSEIANFLTTKKAELFASDTYSGDLTVVTKSRGYFDDLAENQEDYGINAPRTLNEMLGIKEPTGGDTDPGTGNVGPGTDDPTNPGTGNTNPGTGNNTNNTQNNNSGNAANNSSSDNSTVMIVIIVAGVVVLILIIVVVILIVFFLTKKSAPKAAKVEKVVEETAEAVEAAEEAVEENIE